MLKLFRSLAPASALALFFLFPFVAQSDPPRPVDFGTSSIPSSGDGLNQETRGALQLGGSSFCGNPIQPANWPKEISGKLKRLDGMVSIDELRAVEAAFVKYRDSWVSCHSKASNAQTLCIEQCSPQIQNATVVLNGVAAAARGAGGTNFQCGAAAQVLNIVQGALSAFQVACGGAKALCHSTCETAQKAAQEMRAKLNELMGRVRGSKDAISTACKANPPAGATQPAAPRTLPSDLMAKYFLGTPTITPEQCTPTAIDAAFASAISARQTTISSAIEDIEKELNTGQPASIAAREKACQGYTMQLVAGAGSLGTMLALQKDAEACKKETEPEKPIVAGTDCTKPENAQKTDCLCLANPRLPGCLNNLDRVGGEPVTISATPIQAEGVNGNSGSPNLDLTSGAGAPPLPTGGTDASGGGLPGGGGGGMGLGGGSGGSAAARGADGAGGARSRLSANVLGGESGGGGGGGWGSGGGSGSGSGSGLRSFLPGGANDPAARAPTAAGGPPQITTSAGRSNFEKVSDRYQDNRPRLLTNR